MTDTRAANPEYQLDVDVMIIEHTVYYAIEAKLKALKLEFTGEVDETISENAARLIENFDILIRLFHQNHPSPTTTLSGGTIFNIKILEFLILFDEWLVRTPCGPTLLRERSINTIFRRKWLTSWAIIKEGPGRDIRPYIDKANVSERLTQPNTISLDDMLVHFLDLSADMGDAVGGVSDAWYRLSAEFMIQCAIERVQHLIETNTLHGPGGVNYIKGIAAWLSECFAWGIIWPFSHEIKHEDEVEQTQIRRRIKEETRIREIFRVKDLDNPSSNPDSDGDTHMTQDEYTTKVREHPEWTRERTRLHTDIINMTRSCTNSRDCTCVHSLNTIRAQHPIDKFLRDLHKFVEGCWYVNLDTITGKPVLVQIEDGAIEGMDEAEFQGFLKRIGLSVGVGVAGDGRGVVKWRKLPEVD